MGRAAPRAARQCWQLAAQWTWPSVARVGPSCPCLLVLVLCSAYLQLQQTRATQPPLSDDSNAACVSQTWSSFPIYCISDVKYDHLIIIVSAKVLSTFVIMSFPNILSFSHFLVSPLRIINRRVLTWKVEYINSKDTLKVSWENHVLKYVHTLRKWVIL